MTGANKVAVRLLVGGLLAMTGGLLMVWSGYVSRGLLFLAIGYAQSEIPAYLTGFAASAASLSISVFELIIALGGVTVVAGGALLVAGHARTGRVLIFLGGGAGFLGLVGSLGYTVYKLGIDQAVSYAPYWIGLFFAAAGRRLAKGFKSQVK